MAEQSDAGSHGRDPVRSADVQSGHKFDEVLRDELRIVAARRVRLDVERGDLTAAGPSAAGAPSAAWHARLLGLSFSGGGIRSATLNLGVLQGLARCGVLRYVDYLSTVSGGGYIGSWLTALSQRRFARTAADAERAHVVDTTSLLPFDAAGFKSFEKGLAWSAGDGGCWFRGCCRRPSARSKPMSRVSSSHGWRRASSSISSRAGTSVRASPVSRRRTGAAPSEHRRSFSASACRCC